MLHQNTYNMTFKLTHLNSHRQMEVSFPYLMIHCCIAQYRIMQHVCLTEC